jgi:hypothetical protein
MLRSELPPIRSQLPTLPYDLSEYARTNTGPNSWSADGDADPNPHPAFDEPHDPAVFFELEPLDGAVSGELMDVRPTDVPRVEARCETTDAEGSLEPRARTVLALLDGRSSVEVLLEKAELPGAELLTILCDLCMRGFVAFDRAA